jgi:signal transduction histidine kinase
MLRDVRRRLARRLDPVPPPPPAEPAADPLWPQLGQQFALRLLASAYQLGSHLAEAEAAERDPDQLRRLLHVDHAVTQIRRQTENLQVLTGRRIDDAGRQVTALLDVVRSAVSAIEQYDRVQIGHVADLAVAEHAADDVIRVLTELADNATRYSSPSTPVTVSAHLTEHGTVLLRVEDSGVGVEPARLSSLNAMLAGEAGPALVGTAQLGLDGSAQLGLDGSAQLGLIGAAQLGLIVVRRLAEIHGLRVSLTQRLAGGTVAAVLLPVRILCEVPAPHRAAIAAVPPKRSLAAAAGPPEAAPRSSAHTLSRTLEPGPSRLADDISAFAEGLADAERARATTSHQGIR